MFIAVISGYIVAAIMAFCGICGLFQLFASGELAQGSGVAAYVQAVATASWPLAASAIVFVLVQIAILLEKLVILRSMAPVESVAGSGAARNTGAESRKKHIPSIPEMTRGFFHIEPDSIPRQEGQAPAPGDAQPGQGPAASVVDELENITALAQHAENERLQQEDLHPERIPEVLPQDYAPHEFDDWQQDEPDKDPGASPTANDSRPQTLNFFRVD